MIGADALPKFICSICFQKVSEFHEFYCGVHVAQQNFIDNAIEMEASTKAIITRGPTEMEYPLKHAKDNNIEYSEMNTSNIRDSEAMIEVIEFSTDAMIDVKEESEEHDGYPIIKVENIQMDEDIQGLQFTLVDKIFEFT